MYCARCGSPLTGNAKTCAKCEADLTAAGSVRLTDPTAEPGFPPKMLTPAPTMTSAKADDAAVDPWAIGASGAAVVEVEPTKVEPAKSSSELSKSGTQPAKSGAEAAQLPMAGFAASSGSDDADGEDSDSSESKHLARVLGIDMVRPTARTLVALLVLFTALVLMMLLMAGFMNLDRFILGKASSTESTVYVTESGATPQSAEPTAQPS